MALRILITGSRDWTDRDTLYQALAQHAEPYATVVSGACPTGADRMAEEWGEIQPDITVERHPADWERFGRSAGPKRNREMVNLGADICLAFIKNNSRGASMTADLAERADIPTVRFVE